MPRLWNGETNVCSRMRAQTLYKLYDLFWQLPMLLKEAQPQRVCGNPKLHRPAVVTARKKQCERLERVLEKRFHCLAHPATGNDKTSFRRSCH